MKYLNFASAFLAALILAGGILPVSGICAETIDTSTAEAAYTEASNDDFNYRVYSDHIEITKVTATGEVAIPDEIDGLPVTDWNPETTFQSTYVRQFTISENNPYFSIVNDGLICNTSQVYIMYLGLEGEYDSLNGPWLEEYVIPDGIKVVGAQAFRNGRAIKHITMPDSVEMLGFGAFQSTMVSKISISANVSRIEPAALNTNHLEEIELSPENQHFALIDGVLFNKEKDTLMCYPQADPAASYAIPEGTTTLLRSCFINCRYITELTLPSTFSEGESELDSLFALEKYTVSEDNPAYASHEGLLYTKDKTRLIRVPINILTAEDFIVPDGTKVIGNYAINNSYIEKITLPASVEEIERYGLVNGRYYLKALTVYNPACEFNNAMTDFGMHWVDGEQVSSGTIYGYEDSTAAAYASKEGVKFAVIEDVTETTTEPTTDVPEDTATGDVDGDGALGVTDVILYQKYLLGVQNTTIDDLKTADLCEDGSLDAFDLAVMKRKLIQGA